LDHVFLELSIITIVALLVSGFMTFLKQPLIIGYILAGILMGPSFLNIVKSADSIATFAHLGVAVLLFMVGLNLSPKIIKDVGKVSLITGLGQVVFTSTIGFGIGLLLGLPYIVAAYVAIALTFSSTIIIMKILADKGDLDSLYGKISIGFLIVQDIVAMLILMVISAFSQTTNFGEFALTFVITTLAAIGAMTIVSVYVLPKVMKQVARSQEFLFLFSLGWCLLLAMIFHEIKFSMEIGALLAGVSLSMSPYRFEITSKMKPLRDFFIFMFFVLLGSQMVFTNISAYAVPIAVFSLFVLIGNPLIVLFLMGRLGYTRKNGFLAGLTVAQISEFSLILIAMGVKTGQLTNETLSMVTVIGLITIAGSTYAMIYSEKIYPRLEKYLSIFDRKGKPNPNEDRDFCETHEIVLFGYDRIGYSMVKTFKKLGSNFLVVDYNPDIIFKLTAEKLNCKYGDASDLELLDELCFAKTKMVVSTIPDYDTSSLIINKVRAESEDTIMVVVSHRIEESIKLYEQGATYVIMPQFLGGDHASALIERHGFNMSSFMQEKISHIEHLGIRKGLGHDHGKKKLVKK
jgi:Kef-type K+ transport system membrane component KefB